MPTTGQLPVDLLHWILSAASVIALLIFLVPLKWRAPEAGPAAMFVEQVLVDGKWMPRFARVAATS